jgi:hypothetical protein
MIKGGCLLTELKEAETTGMNVQTTTAASSALQPPTRRKKTVGRPANVGINSSTITKMHQNRTKSSIKRCSGRKVAGHNVTTCPNRNQSAGKFSFFKIDGIVANWKIPLDDSTVRTPVQAIVVNRSPIPIRARIGSG